MVTPPIEENIVRVSISNELVESVLEDQELQGLLPIPNDDMDYADYVDAVTEGGDINGPFTGVQLDFTQLIPEQPSIELYTRYSYLSLNRTDARNVTTSYYLTDTVFTQTGSTQTVTIQPGRAIIKISQYDSNGYFNILYYNNKSSTSSSVGVNAGDYYTNIQLPNNDNSYPYFHLCATNSNDDLGEFIILDPYRGDSYPSALYIKNTVYRIFVRTE